MRLQVCVRSTCDDLLMKYFRIFNRWGIGYPILVCFSKEQVLILIQEYLKKRGLRSSLAPGASRGEQLQYHVLCMVVNT